MAAEETPTGFEWLDDSLEGLISFVKWLTWPFNLTRLLVTFWGALCMLGVVGNALLYLEGPPDLHSKFMPFYREGLAFCWLDPDPGAGFLLSLALLTPSIGALALVWRLPRVGFLLAAPGWILCLSGPFFHSHREFDHPAWIVPWLVVPCLWFVFAAWKLKPRQQRA